jgi:hypothetical protein
VIFHSCGGIVKRAWKFQSKCGDLSPAMEEAVRPKCLLPFVLFWAGTM